MKRNTVSGKSRSKAPAILDGAPVFSQKVSLVRPVLPGMDELASDMKCILSSGMVTKGRYLRQFEEDIQEHLHVKHAVAVSSCTTGLMLTYKALGLHGDVVVPSFTFMATVSALVWCGLNPIFADVDGTTTNLDVQSARAAITPDTTAIVGVHNFGNPADIRELIDLTQEFHLKLIFDAAHGFGALYQGTPLGPQGSANIFSSSPTKLLITGEGGVVATNDDDLAAAVRMGREYGNDGSYDSAFAGINARMAEFNALLGHYSLKRLGAAARSRNATVELYQEMLGQIPGIEFQTVRTGNRSSYKDFSIVVYPEQFGLTRDELQLALNAENIDTRKYYAPPVHQQRAYKQFFDHQRGLPVTDWLAANSLSLPIWSFMPDEVVKDICIAIANVFENRDKICQILNSSKELQEINIKPKRTDPAN
jgi:dTDP-4-amino-4,6-dideoxygalactose transaminase